MPTLNKLIFMNTEPKLYKFTKRKYAEELVRNGSIQIGTLHDFQNLEKHRAEVGDAQEGKRSTFIGPDEQGQFHVDKLEILGSTLTNVNMSGNGGMPIAIMEATRQYYILCFSIKPDAEAMRRMGYDTCVQIDNPKLFCYIVTQAMITLGKTAPIGRFHLDFIRYLDPVVYPVNAVNNKSYSGKHLPVYLQKHPEFAYQNEARVVWEPSGEQAKPFIVQSGLLKSLCHIIEI
jgi:hypothetical protein